MEERCPYKAEVTGSIPVPPTRVLHRGANRPDNYRTFCCANVVLMSNSEEGAVVQPGLGRQIVNLEVAGSNPVGPATFLAGERKVVGTLCVVTTG